MDRRQFLKFVGKGLTGLALAPILNACGGSSGRSSSSNNNGTTEQGLNLSDTINYLTNTYGLTQISTPPVPTFWYVDTQDNNKMKKLSFKSNSDFALYQGPNLQSNTRILVTDASIKLNLGGIEDTPNIYDDVEVSNGNFGVMNDSNIISVLTQGNTKSQLETLLNNINAGIYSTTYNQPYILFEWGDQAGISSTSNSRGGREDINLGTQTRTSQVLTPNISNLPTTYQILNPNGTSTGASYGVSFDTGNNRQIVADQQITTLNNGTYLLSDGFNLIGIVHKGIKSDGTTCPPNYRARDSPKNGDYDHCTL